MAVAAVHYRSGTVGLPTALELMPYSTAIRPGDVQAVKEDDAVWGVAEVEKLVLVSLPGEAADWAHLTDEVTESVPNPDYDPEVDDPPDAVITTKVSERRWFIDLRSALGVNVQRNLEDRQSRLIERDEASVFVAAKGEAMGEATSEDRATMLKQVQASVRDLDRLDGEMKLLHLVPEPVAVTHVCERVSDG